jgi:hypothetical protein
VCHHPELATNPGRYLTSTPTWREDGVRITPSDGTMFEANTSPDGSSTTLTINITADHFRNKLFYYSCFLVLAGASAGQLETSQNVTVDPIAQPGPPVVTMAATDSNITLTWNTTLHCFESKNFSFVIIWNKIGSGTSNNVTISSSPYTISRLQPGTSYEVSVHGVSGSGVVSERRVLNVTTGVKPPDVLPTIDVTTIHPAIIAVAVVVPSITILIIIIILSIVISCLVVRLWKRNATYQTDEHHGVHELLESPTIREPTSSDQFRTNYAELAFEGVQPIKPPPLECEVTYTEALAPGERIVVKEDPVPELPPKRQDPKQGKEFRADVANVLTKLGVHTLVCREVKNVPFLTGDYNGIHFVAYCVHTSSDVTAEDVRRIVEAKQVTGATKGLLIANQGTIPSDCLLDLDKGGCEFVPVSYYGDEGWGNKMADKFQEFFPIVDTSDDGGEELPNPVQESTQSDNSYPLDLGIVRSSLSFGCKSLTEPAEDEVDVIDSREETPLLESFDNALNRGEATPDDQSTLPVSASSSVDHLPTQPPADPFRSAPDAENDVDESASQSQSSSDSGFTFTFDLTVNDGHEEEDFVLPQESNQLATPVETSDPAHDSLDPLPSPANTVCVSEEVIHNEFVEDEKKAFGETHVKMPHTGRLVCAPGSNRELGDDQFNTECLPTPVQDTTPPPLCGGYLRFADLTFCNLMHTEHPRVSGEKSSSDAENYFLDSKPPPTKKPPVSWKKKKKSCEAKKFCVFSTMHPLAKLNEVLRTGPQFYEDTSVSTSSVSHSESPSDSNLYLLEYPVEDGHVTHGRHMDGFQANPCPVTKRSDNTGSVLQDTLSYMRYWSAPDVKLDEINNDGTIVPDTQCTEEKTVTPLEETPLQPTDTLCVGFDWMYSLPVTESGYGRFVTGFLKKKSEPLTEAGQFEHTSPREPCRAVKYVEKSNHHPQLQSIPYHTNVHWATFLLLIVLHLSGARFIE